MRTTCIAAIALMVAGCEPYEPPPPPTEGTLRIGLTNEYADSLFTIRGAPAADGGTTTAVFFEDTRIEGYRTKESEVVLTVPYGSTVQLEIGSMSLGDRKQFPPVQIENVRRTFCTFLYDYDLATARFAIGKNCAERTY